MGLDVSWYRGASYDEYDSTHRNSAGELIDHQLVVRVYSNFPERADDILPGAYRVEESGSFRAGSYSGYNRWRDTLAKLAGYPSAVSLWGGVITSGPFYELINFSDCEGVIGTAVSTKLAADFRNWQSRASRVTDLYFVKIYNEFQNAFENASDRGFVDFG